MSQYSLAGAVPAYSLHFYFAPKKNNAGAQTGIPSSEDQTVAACTMSTGPFLNVTIESD